jgi:hypothetical protein
MPTCCAGWQNGSRAIRPESQTPGCIAIWVNHSNIGENVRATALKGAEVLLAPHQTGGCDSLDPHTTGLVDKALWENRHADPAAIEAELRGPKGRGWLMRWLPARAHDNGLFLVYSNGVLSLRKPDDPRSLWPHLG